MSCYTVGQRRRFLDFQEPVVLWVDPTFDLTQPDGESEESSTCSDAASCQAPPHRRLVLISQNVPVGQCIDPEPDTHEERLRRVRARLQSEMRCQTRTWCGAVAGTAHWPS